MSKILIIDDSGTVRAGLAAERPEEWVPIILLERQFGEAVRRREPCR